MFNRVRNTFGAGPQASDHADIFYPLPNVVTLNPPAVGGRDPDEVLGPSVKKYEADVQARSVALHDVLFGTSAIQDIIGTVRDVDSDTAARLIALAKTYVTQGHQTMRERDALAAEVKMAEIASNAGSQQATVMRLERELDEARTVAAKSDQANQVMRDEASRRERDHQAEIAKHKKYREDLVGEVGHPRMHFATGRKKTSSGTDPATSPEKPKE